MNLSPYILMFILLRYKKNWIIVVFVLLILSGIYIFLKLCMQVLYAFFTASHNRSYNFALCITIRIRNYLLELWVHKHPWKKAQKGGSALNTKSFRVISKRLNDTIFLILWIFKIRITKYFDRFINFESTNVT